MSDLISRDEAINALKRHLDEDYLDGYVYWNELKAIPSAEPERKTGKWICEFADNGWIDHICSECGWTKNTDVHVHIGYKFCPNCGAEMTRGEHDIPLGKFEK